MLPNIKNNVCWEAAFFDLCKEKTAKNEAPPEDQRMADWRFFLSLPPQAKALIIGSGLGTIPISLTGACQKVYVADASQDRINFLRLRKEQQGLEALSPMQVLDLEELGFLKSSLDFVSINPGEQRAMIKEKNLSQTITCLAEFIQPGGTLHLMLENRFSLQGWMRRRRRNHLSHSLPYYRRILAEQGFRDLEIYAPLPNFDGVPLFYLPLGSSQIIHFFLEKILPLIEMVSPETKKAYALEYRMAKVALGLAARFKLGFLLPYFVSGYCIIARKEKNAPISF